MLANPQPHSRHRARAGAGGRDQIKEFCPISGVRVMVAHHPQSPSGGCCPGRCLLLTPFLQLGMWLHPARCVVLVSSDSSPPSEQGRGTSMRRGDATLEHGVTGHCPFLSQSSHSVVSPSMRHILVARVLCPSVPCMPPQTQDFLSRGCCISEPQVTALPAATRAPGLPPWGLVGCDGGDSPTREGEIRVRCPEQ